MFGCLNFFKIRSSFASAFRRLGVCRVPCAVRCMGFVAASELQPRPLCQHTVNVVSAYREWCVSIPWMAQSAILRNGTDAVLRSLVGGASKQLPRRALCNAGGTCFFGFCLEILFLEGYLFCRPYLCFFGCCGFVQAGRHLLCRKA